MQDSHYEDILAKQLAMNRQTARCRAMWGMGYTDAFGALHVGEIGHFTFSRVEVGRLKFHCRKAV
jgi:hypothetical protein